MSKPSIPQGTRDFSSETVRKRNFILSTARKVFELYGFQPLETPAFENLETLMGKYGEEGDKLLFKILNNGLADPKNVEKTREGFEKLLQGKNSTNITERALKYDLTIPFARYVAMNHGQLTFPFKRYQVQPVWRADRPQKGRYREFTQCDADVVGSSSLLNEIELANIYHDIFTALGLTGYQLLLNSRKILAGLAELCGEAERLTDITIAIDKLDKIGPDKVKEELAGRGLQMNAINIITKYLQVSGTNEEKLEILRQMFAGNSTGMAGVQELEIVSRKCDGVNASIDVTLARGLNYYTGLIFEVKAPAAVKMGSIGGGGRYDDLTGLFGLPNMAGVGISLGVDRIYDVMEELSLFPENVQVSTQVLFFNMGDKESEASFGFVQALRHNNIACELFPETSKMDKQFRYAERKTIPYVAIIGSKEMEKGTMTLKTLATGEQKECTLDELILFFS